MRTQAVVSLDGIVTESPSHRRGRASAAVVAAMAILTASILLAPPAIANSADALRSAMMSVRSASCGPLRSDPLVEKTAEIVNRSEDLWLNQDGRAVPLSDPLPTLKDLGYGGAKATQFQGAAHNESASIKGLLIEGYLAWPDCSYRTYGVSVLKNRTTDYILSVVVLAV
jgi:hypothetical protein